MNNTWYCLQINGMSDWYLVNIETNRTLNIFPLTISPNILNDSVIGAELAGNEDDVQKVVYFGAPNYYLGKSL